ncbi:MAG: YihA family ribosome biogenesis GTP-binding protein [Clostridia bacterium]|nr:YihA family ribosome biogenesis GTP-binding protein [Clostridia bacterium]
MIIKKAEHEITAVRRDQYPEGNRPEIAFVGRSNVGKSSMINALCNRKGIARVGQTPGKTRVLNFYTVNDEIYLVDLPGYGYAKAGLEQKKIWNRFTDNYLNIREQLVLIVLLIDIRHAPSVEDAKMMDWLKERDIPYAVCGVKCDKLSNNKAILSARKIVSMLEVEPDTPFILFSATKKQGIEELWEVIDFYISDSE